MRSSYPRDTTYHIRNKCIQLGIIFGKYLNADIAFTSRTGNITNTIQNLLFF